MALIFCTLSDTGLDDADIPINYFRVQFEGGVLQYISVIVPGMGQSEVIADRSGGNIAIAMETDGVEIEIGQMAITGIRIDNGSRNQSITIEASL
jgi:hypothetical protein